MHITQDQYLALARLESRQDPDWQKVKQLLQVAYEDERDHLLVSSTHESVCRSQGRAGMLRDLLEALKESRQVLKQHS